MTAEHWAHVKEVLYAVLELEPDQRPPYLDRVCAGQPLLRQEVESLILSDSHVDPDFLKTIPPERSSSLDSEITLSLVGRLVGPYRIVEEIGAGGMGEVYRAVRADDQYQKQVAIKVVRRGFDTGSGLRRFKAERQILASLDHPNIARLLDSGSTEDGLPYVVMELVEGQPIDEYCEGQNLSLVERLQLFRLVCAAVHYAHQHLVVHRDLKPSNILVTKEGEPKLLDFGIAKLLAPETFAQPQERTATFMRAMTPEFASPEQVRGEAITTASDGYSLGVVLYRLLTGCGPYRTVSDVPHEIAREICESEPQKPSIAIARAGEPITGHGGSIRIASIQTQETRRLRRRLAGDLDNIVLMALRKDPLRRYASAEQFAEDIRRYLNKLPVLARRDTFLYRAGKFIRRHSTGVAAAAIVVIALLSGILATFWQAHVARVERDKAQRRFNEVRKLANAVLFKYHDGIEKLPGSTPVRAMMVRDALEYLDNLYRESEGDSSLQRELATAYAKVGDVQSRNNFGNIGDVKGAVESYRKALAMREKIAAVDPSSAEDQRSLAAIYLDLGLALDMAGDHAHYLEVSRKALEIYRKLTEIDPASVKSRSALARGYWHVANASASVSDFGAAIDHYREAARIYADLSAAEPSNPQHRRNAALTYKYLATLLEDSGDIQGALELDRKAITMDKVRLASDPGNTQAKLDLSFSYGEVGVNRSRVGDISGALASYKDAMDLRLSVARADPQNAFAQSAVARACESIGTVLMLSGKPVDALRQFQKAFQLIQALASVDPKNAAMQAKLIVLKARMGNAMVEAGRIAEGRLVLQQALVEAVALVGTSGDTQSRTYQALIQMWMGEALERAGNSNGALQYYSQAFQVYSDISVAAPGNMENRVNVVAASTHLGGAYLKIKRLAKAGEEYHKALGLADAMGPSNAGNIEVLYAQADTYAGLGDLSAMLARNAGSAKARSMQWNEARHWCEKSLSAWQKIPNPGRISPTGFETSAPRQIAGRFAQCTTELTQVRERDEDSK